MEKLQYPIGKFEMPLDFDRKMVQSWIDEIKTLPSRFRMVAQSLSDEQLATAYRPDGWTGQQVIHHVADSHMNAFIRFKWTLTEDSPTIKAYYEDRWALLADSLYPPISISLNILESVHYRWIVLLDSMEESDFRKYYIHPEYGKKYPLGAVCKLYAWHGNHHLAHLQILKGDL